MGDRRFAAAYLRLRDSPEPAATIHVMSDEDVVQALAHASREHEPYLANVLATEALNRLAQRHRWLRLVETFYHVHDQLGIGLIIVDGGKTFYANDAFRRLVGRDLDELRALPSLLELVCEADRGAVAEDFTAMLAGERPIAARTVCLLRSDGEQTPVEVLVAVAPPASAQDERRLVCIVQPGTRQSS